MTALSLVSYGVLMLDFYYRRPQRLVDPVTLVSRFDIRPDRHVIIFVALVVVAGAVAYLVQRVRALSSYYGQKL